MQLKTNEAYCVSCNEVKSRQDAFYRIFNTHYKRGVSPICKECAEKIYNELYTKLGRPDAAMWCICSYIGVPFKFDIWQQVVADYTDGARANNMKRHAPIAKYLELLGKEYSGFFESDRMLSSFIGIDIDKNIETDQELNDRREEQHKNWGEFGDEALDWLDGCYTDYTNGIGHMDKITVARYRDLCKAEWLKRKADEGGDVAEINKARDNVTAMLKILKLDNFKGNERTDEEKRIEKMTWNYENVGPAECEDLDKYRNFSGFAKPWDDFKRTVSNLVGGTKDFPNVPRSER